MIFFKVSESLHPIDPGRDRPPVSSTRLTCTEVTRLFTILSNTCGDPVRTCQNIPGGNRVLMYNIFIPDLRVLIVRLTTVYVGWGGVPTLYSRYVTFERSISTSHEHLTEWSHQNLSQLLGQILSYKTPVIERKNTNKMEIGNSFHTVSRREKHCECYISVIIPFRLRPNPGSPTVYDVRL